jgi:non-specific serine/threonine protein kinase/serine/threonine-protein kinase
LEREGHLTGQTTKAQWARIQATFDDLVDVPREERTRRLAMLEDHSVAAKVQLLLDASAARGILDGAAPPLDAPQSALTYSSLTPGECVGGFEIERLIGRGGMGEVYLAHRRSADFDQRVALKLLRPEAVARAELFDRERRLLASLEHPGIARLIDGGVAPDGRAYMAMEFVSGQPIDAWCRDHTAPLAARLKLFCEVCDAVVFAHANLIIHRDLKPSNILVDEAGRPRLLDFGIARIIDEDAAMATTAALMTPDYAAPEQLDNAATTVATDVYALGAVLFELVAGRGPWRDEGASLPSIIRRALNDDPPLPSRLAASGKMPFPASAVAGDIDAIVMKAMRRNPLDRYRGVTELADDIRRHLELKPVRARTGSTGYAVGRFVRRYRIAVGAAAAALAALLIGAGGIAWQARQTAIERDVALAEARRSESIVRMLTVMFRDTATSAGEAATVKQMLDQTATRLVGSLDTSARSATLITTLFDLYLNLEDGAGADSLIRQAMAKGIGKDDPIATAQMRMRLASSAAAMNKTEEMAPLLDAAEAVFRADPERFRSELVEINSDRAQLLRRTGRIEEAIRLLTATLPQADLVYAENHRDLLTIYNNLLVYMVEANQLDAMPAVFARADAILTRTGQQGSMQGLAIAQLRGVRLLKLNQAEHAEAIFQQVAAQRRAVFGQSAGLAVDLLQLGRARLALGKFPEALRALTEARPMAVENLGPAAVPTLFIGLGIAEAAAETGDTAAAERALADVASPIGAMKKPSLPQGALARTLAVVRLNEGRLAEARQELIKAEAIFTQAGPSGTSFLASLPALRARIARAGH